MDLTQDAINGILSGVSYGFFSKGTDFEEALLEFAETTAIASKEFESQEKFHIPPGATITQLMSILVTLKKLPSLPFSLSSSDVKQGDVKILFSEMLPKVYKPYLRKMIKLPNINGDNFVEITRDDLIEKPVTFKYPTINNQKKWSLPSYKPVRHFTAYDKGILEHAAINSDKDEKGDGTFAYAFLWATARLTYFGNGTWQGQVKRLQKAYDIQSKSVIPKPFRDKPLMAVEVWSRFMPINPLPDYLAWTDNFTATRRQVFSVDGKERAIIVMPNKYGSSGPPWPSGQDFQKGHTIMADITMCEQLLADMRKLGTDALLQKWPWLFLSRAAPKDEVYMRDDLYEKTRNIYTVSAVTNYMLDIMYSWAHFHRPNYQTNPELWNLYGFSFTNRDFDAFVTNLVGLVKGTVTPTNNAGLDDKVLFIGVFSDNVFLLVKHKGHDYWLSCDGSSMEASCDWRKACMITDFLNAELKKSGRVSQSWARLYATLFPNTLGNSAFLLEHQQARLPQQPSGNRFTGEVNGYIMSLAVAWWLHNGAPFPGTQSKPTKRFVDLFAAMGVQIKVELSVKNFAKKVTEEKFVDMDFLGYGCTQYYMKGTRSTYVPTLQPARLSKALLYAKKNVGDTIDKFFAGAEATPDQRAAISHAIKLTKLKSLYLQGGWAYPGFRAIIINTFQMELKNGQKLKKPLEGFQMLDDYINKIPREFANDAFGIQFYHFVEDFFSQKYPKDKDVYKTYINPRSTQVLPEPEITMYASKKKDISGKPIPDDLVRPSETDWTFRKVLRFDKAPTT